MPQLGEGQQNKRANKEKLLKLLATWKLDAADEAEMVEILDIETAVLKSEKAAAQNAAQQAGGGAVPPGSPMGGGMPGMGGPPMGPGGGMPSGMPPMGPPLQGPDNPGGVGGVGQMPPPFNADELRRLIQ